MANPEVQWTDIKNKPHLFLRFIERFTSEDAQVAIRTIQPMVDKVDGRFTMVWECSDMVGFETGAREAWQVFIKNIKPKIETIHLISRNILIRTGARVVGIYAGIKIVAWASLDAFQDQV
jgi:hypothetical protein